MIVSTYKKLLIILFCLLIKTDVFCFFEDKINLNTLPYYSFLSEVEEKEEYKERVLFIKKRLKEIVSSINKKNIYFNTKIKKKLLDILQRLDKFEKINLRDIRKFQVAVSDFDNYLAQYIDTFILFLNKNEKEFLGVIRSFNSQAIKLLQDQDYLKFTGLQKTEDLIFFRPLEFVSKHKKKIGYGLATSGVLLYSFVLHPKIKDILKKRSALRENKILRNDDDLIIEDIPNATSLTLDSRNADYNVLQIIVNKQKEAECALHAFWNCCLGLISDSVEQFQENEIRYSDDFDEWIRNIRINFGDINWSDGGVLESIIRYDDLHPDFLGNKTLDDIRILRALPNSMETFLNLHGGRLNGEGLSPEVYSSVIETEFDGSLESFYNGEPQNLILLIGDHFVSLKLTRNDTNVGELEAWVTNSLRNSDYTNNDGVKNVLNYYINNLK